MYFQKEHLESKSKLFIDSQIFNCYTILIYMVIIDDQEEYTIHRGLQRANGSESLALLGMWNGPGRYSLIHTLLGVG